MQQDAQLNEHFVQLEAIAESHQSLVQEAANGTQSANVVLHKVLAQLEELLNEMKGDVSRLPATLTRLPSVTERLQMTERQILNRLTTKDPEAAAGLSPLPPPGPFFTQAMNQKFNGIQPKFAALHGEGFATNDEENEGEKEKKQDVSMTAEVAPTAEKVEEVKPTDVKKEGELNGKEKEVKTNGTSAATTITNGTSETTKSETEKEETKPENGDVEMKEVEDSHATNGTDEPPKLVANGMEVEAPEVEEEKMDTTEAAVVDPPAPSTKEPSTTAEIEEEPIPVEEETTTEAAT
jgi:hypothetical protein